VLQNRDFQDGGIGIASPRYPYSFVLPNFFFRKSIAQYRMFLPESKSRPYAVEANWF